MSCVPLLSLSGGGVGRVIRQAARCDASERVHEDRGEDAELAAVLSLSGGEYFNTHSV
jgi:hypothetical protein